MTSFTRAAALCGAVIALMAVPSHQSHTSARQTSTCFATPSTRYRRAASSSSRSPFQGSRGRRHGYVYPRLQSTELAASKNKSKSKKKKSSSRGGSGGGGFGAAVSAPTVAEAPQLDKRETPPPPASPKSPAPSRSAASAPAGQLPDDDFATFPPLSPETLKSVMGVDVFDLPPRGIPASERGQEQALPSQVLECIRDRHGLEEFAGGRRLLDPEYGVHEAAEEREGGGAAGEGLLFPGLRLLHAEPPVIGVDDFFTSGECDEYVSRSVSPPPAAASASGVPAGEKGPHMQRSATLGADVDAVAQRTSTTWFHRFSAVPELMAKASALVGVPFEEGRWEEAQTVRYRPGEKFTWHLDALPPGPELASKGGQRIATLLVYLTEMPDRDGGATAFRDLGPLRVRPRKGSALLFFPSCGGAPDCPFDIRTLHAGEVVRRGAAQDKWIAQLWLRERRYTPTVPKENRHADAESAVAEFDKSWRAS